MLLPVFSVPKQHFVAQKIYGEVVLSAYKSSDVQRTNDAHLRMNTSSSLI